MDTSFGIRGTIVPPFHKPQSWVSGSFQLSVENGVIAIGYDDEALADKARVVVRLYLAAHNLENGTNYQVDLNQTWRTYAGSSKTIGLELSDKSSVTESLSIRVTQGTITGLARIVKPGFDSETLANQTALVDRCKRDPALASALTYFNEEVIDDDRPMYGVYKAIEALSKALPGGKEALGKLVGHGKTYVSDVTRTAQLTRHHNDPNAKQVITDEECKERARIMIRAYANTVQS